MREHLRQESGTTSKNDWESLLPEPAKPERQSVEVSFCDVNNIYEKDFVPRQASEIEKRAALAFVRWNAAKLAVAAQSLPTMWDTESIYETSQLQNILDASDIVRESEMYAKSIGAIE